jgi:hypothetical protein
VVGVIGEELMDQVSVSSMEFNTIESSTLSSLSATSEVCDDLLDVLLISFFGSGENLLII